MRNRVIILNIALLIVATPAFCIDQDAKTIPKSILMLGMYCNSASIEMKNHFDTNNMSIPWIAYGPKAVALPSVFTGLDFQGWGYAKSIKDKALTQNEILFLVLTAKKDTAIWLDAAVNTCGKVYGSDDYEPCLKGINSEVYKCYLQILERAKALDNPK